MITLVTRFGAEIAPFIREVAGIRIRGFRAFPYLYEGSLDYEEKYLEMYATEGRAMLVRAMDGEKTVAIATATPLHCSCDIVADAPVLMRRAGFAPETFFHYAEIIVLPEYRGRGIARMIYAEREKTARGFGFTNLCLASVVRAEDHPLKPRDYVPAERVWIKDGFQPTEAYFTYDWPTIQADGSVREEANPMRFWTRALT